MSDGILKGNSENKKYAYKKIQSGRKLFEAFNSLYRSAASWRNNIYLRPCLRKVVSFIFYKLLYVWGFEKKMLHLWSRYKSGGYLK